MDEIKMADTTQMTQEYNNDQPEQKPKMKNKKTAIIGTIILIVVLLAGGWMLTRDSSSISIGEDPTPTPTEAPTPIPEPEFAKEDYSIKILNGSGEPGIAGLVQEALEEDGFTVSDTGNADNYEYESTEVRAKVDVPSGFVDELIESLEGQYTVTEGEDLEDDEDVDVIVIVGAS